MSAKIINTATPFLENVAKNNPKYRDRALKSAGWFLQQEIKKGIVKQAPGGQPYKPFSSVTTSRRLEAIRGRRGQKARNLRAPHRPMGRLRPATRYKFYSDSHRVLVGWISKSAERLGTIQEIGKKVPVTPKMRKFFWAAGYRLSKKKKYIFIPKRPTIDPEYRKNMSKIPKYMKEKILGYMEGSK